MSNASATSKTDGGDVWTAGIFPFIQRVFADSGYAGEKVTTATLIAVEIVRKNPDQVGFAVNPRRWVVERFFAWIGRNRRLAPSSTPPALVSDLPRRLRFSRRPVTHFPIIGIVRDTREGPSYGALNLLGDSACVYGTRLRMHDGLCGAAVL